MVQDASAIINNEILDFDTVNKLSLWGSNYKLQQGFKELYDTTVNGYVQNRRLDIANNFLKNSDLSISEIVYLIGLSSRSYFSQLFKDRYGITPSAARKSHDPKK